MNRLDAMDQRIRRLEEEVVSLKSLVERLIRCSVDPKLQAYLDGAVD